MIQQVPKAEWNRRGLPGYFEVLEMSKTESRWPRIDQFSFHGAILDVNHEVETPHTYRNGNVLTSQEETTLILRSIGMNTPQTKRNLGIGSGTVSTHLRRTYRKLNGEESCNLDRATALALACGIITVKEPLPADKPRPTEELWIPVLQGVTHGEIIDDIATDTDTNYEDVKHAITNMYDHFGVPGRGALTLYGYLTGAVSLPDLHSVVH